MSSNDFVDKMYQVGIPEVRKYCSPLQALFWLACENRIQAQPLKSPPVLTFPNGLFPNLTVLDNFIV